MSPSPAFLSYAFRPFFLFNGLFAIGAIALWVLILHGQGTGVLLPDPVSWHAHEMLLGFGLASVAGFVLTAVATWTGRPPISGATLAGLVAAWLTGRLAMLGAPLAPAWTLSLADMAFPVALTLLVAREVIAGHSPRNGPIVVIIALTAIANGFYHAGLNGLIDGAERWPLHAMMHLLVLLIAVIGGRILPSFTANWLRARGQPLDMPATGLLDKAALATTVLTGIAAVIQPVSSATAVCAALAALLHLARLSRWRGTNTTREPLLFSLHAAYAWLPLGYALLAAAAAGMLVTVSGAVHALAIGGIAGMILAVSTRVALGHTGRALHAPPSIVAAYALLGLAALARVAGSLWFSGNLTFLDLSAAAWLGTFAIFCWVYWPILTGPRIDA